MLIIFKFVQVETGYLPSDLHSLCVSACTDDIPCVYLGEQWPGGTVDRGSHHVHLAGGGGHGLL